VYRKIIVGYDDRAEGMDALHLAALLARSTGAELIAASVFPPPAFDPNAHQGTLEADSDFLFEKAQRATPGLALETQALVERSAPKALHELAELEQADLIVLGSSHRGRLGRIYPGSTATRLLHSAPCAIVVAPRGFGRHERAGLRQIAVGYDGLPEARAALRAAEELADAEGAALLLLAVAEPPPLGSGYAITVASMTGALQERLNEGVADVRSGVDASGEMLRGDAGPALVAWAIESDVGLIVVGSRGYGPVRRVLLGSVAVKLMREAPCPVLVAPRPADLRQAAMEAERAGEAEAVDSR
jgi:nucleotide-binding universal stress UspA family protein